jgi:glutathione synthase/RimK-type ligase-like ATP-grasp enzyme
MAVVKSKKEVVKKLTKFRPRIRSRHPSHDILRTDLELLPFRSVVRLGSITNVDVPGIIECNSIEAVKNSANKLLMKRCFTLNGVKTADWWTVNKDSNFLNEETLEAINSSKLPYPIVAKHVFGSRGEGNFLLKDKTELDNWLKGKTLSNYIFEKFYSYSKEYRLHITKDGCFYTCRKMIKEETPKDKRWFRNDSNSTWIVEENPQFDKPSNWNTVIEESVKALKAVGLDVGAVDLKIQTSSDKKGRKRENLEFIVIEINSAPSFGDITAQKYLTIIPKILNEKKSLL